MSLGIKALSARCATRFAYTTILMAVGLGGSGVAQAQPSAQVSLSGLTFTAEAIDASGPAPSFEIHLTPPELGGQAPGSGFGFDSNLRFSNTVSQHNYGYVPLAAASGSYDYQGATATASIGAQAITAAVYGAPAVTKAIEPDQELYVASGLQTDSPMDQDSMTSYLLLGPNTRLAVAGQGDVNVDLSLQAAPCASCASSFVSVVAGWQVLVYDMNPVTWDGIEMAFNTGGVSAWARFSYGQLQDTSSDSDLNSSTPFAFTIDNTYGTAHKYSLDIGAHVDMQHSADVISTPEPATYALVGLGFAGAAVASRRRQRHLSRT